MNSQDIPEDRIISEVIISPEFKKLNEKVERLRIELSMLLSERDELKYVICKNIETAYILEIGALEYKVYEAQCNYLRLNRKLELIQTKINRQEIIDIPLIEGILNKEFIEYKQKLDEQIKMLNEAIDCSKHEVLSDEDAKELKSIYRKIVKALHPDINPNITENQLTLFQNAVEAYKNGDLQSIRIIGEIAAEPHISLHSEDSISKLKNNLENLENMLSVIKDDIAQIKSRYPYTMKEILEDSEKTNQRKDELRNIINQYNERILLLQSRIQELLR